MPETSGSADSNFAAVIFQLPLGVMILYTGGYVFLDADYDMVTDDRRQMTEDRRRRTED